MNNELKLRRRLTSSALLAKRKSRSKTPLPTSLSLPEYSSILVIAQNDPEIKEKITSAPWCFRQVAIPRRARAITRIIRMYQCESSHVVELGDGSAWRIWPGHVSKTLQWLPATELDVENIEDDVCSHALVTRSDGFRVRVTRGNERWPTNAVRRALRER
jgi:hypothetical protein